MGRYASQVETRRFLLLIGAAFGFLLLFQYFELPYSIFPTLLTPSKSEVTAVFTLHNGDSSSALVTKDLAYSGCSNTTNGTLCSSPHESSIDVADAPTKNPFVFEEDPSDEDNVDGEDESSSNSLGVVGNSTSEKVLKNNGSEDIESRKPENDSSSNHNFTNMQAPDEDTGEFSHSDSSPAAESSGNVSGNGNYSEITSVVEDIENRLEDGDPDMILKNIVPAPASSPLLKDPERKVLSISEMKDMLLQSRTAPSSVNPRHSSSADQELSRVKSQILNAPTIEIDAQLDVNVYRNFSEFKRSYESMEQILKVYIYREGEQPIFHRPPLKGIYASEGWFMKLLKTSRRFVTKKPSRAHLFYLPFSSRNLVTVAYIPDSHSYVNLIHRLGSFTDLIKQKYQFWNRTSGADHFLVACHDWAPVETRGIMANCIRSLCNADVKEGFQFGKDASLPETYIQAPQNPLRQLGGKPPSQRRILAFFAGNMHGYLRPILLKHWQNKDPDMKIFGRISKGRGKMSYAQYMKSSKYCICAKGYEVNSPRVVEAIFFECVPVIISDNFVPPFFETLNWESFAVFVPEKDVPNLKEILLGITETRYLEMQQRVKHVQQHFLWHSKPVKYDVFHMILHSVWYNRVFQTNTL